MKTNKMTLAQALEVTQAQQLDNGRYISAVWRERQGQWVGYVSPAPFQGYQYSVARTLEGLARLGVRTYDARRIKAKAARIQAEQQEACYWDAQHEAAMAEFDREHR